MTGLGGELAVSDAISTVTGPETSLNCEAAPPTFSQIVRGAGGGQGGARLRSPEAHGSAPRVSRWGWGRPSPRGQQALPLPVVTCSPHLLPIGDSLPADSLPEPPSTSAPRLPCASSREDLAGSLGGGTKRRSLWPVCRCGRQSGVRPRPEAPGPAASLPQTPVPGAAEAEAALCARRPGLSSVTCASLGLLVPPRVTATRSQPLSDTWRGVTCAASVRQ